MAGRRLFRYSTSVINILRFWTKRQNLTGVQTIHGSRETRRTAYQVEMLGPRNVAPVRRNNCKHFLFAHKGGILFYTEVCIIWLKPITLLAHWDKFCSLQKHEKLSCIAGPLDRRRNCLAWIRRLQRRGRGVIARVITLSDTALAIEVNGESPWQNG